MSATTAEQVLACPLPDNDAGAATVRDYLVSLVAKVWEENEGFSGKRPFGNSGWSWDLYIPLVEAGLVAGTVEDFDESAADGLIANAIEALR